MDNLAHTLAGLALAEAGLKRRTALATATLAIGANLPDVDALVYLVGSGVDALAFRRGWTHGVLAMAVWPVVLAAAMVAWGRLTRRRGSGARQPVRAGWLLVLAAVSVWSHPLLDLLNTYGVRLLMPFSDRWFYGDALFIVDPWLWTVLGAGVLLARLRGRRSAAERTPASARAAERPARAAIALFAVYALAMAASSRLGRVVVGGPAPAARAMVAPVAVTPVHRTVVRDLGAEYERGVLTWGPRPEYAVQDRIPVGRDLPGLAAAAQSADGRKFLSWSRFPRFTPEQVNGRPAVRMSDVRYADARGRGWASVVVPVP